MIRWISQKRIEILKATKTNAEETVTPVVLETLDAEIFLRVHEDDVVCLERKSTCEWAVKEGNSWRGPRTTTQRVYHKIAILTGNTLIMKQLKEEKQYQIKSLRTTSQYDRHLAQRTKLTSMPKNRAGSTASPKKKKIIWVGKVRSNSKESSAETSLP